MWLGGLVAVVVAIVAYAIYIYNSLVRNRQMVAEGWSGIDVQLKRRTDLIPNLLAAVKGYMTHERELFEKITELRSQAQAAHNADPETRAKVEGALTGALMRLNAVMENYPDLKASTNVADFQTSLAEIEDQIQLSRRYYNGAARNLNILVDSFLPTRSPATSSSKRPSSSRSRTRPTARCPRWNSDGVSVMHRFIACAFAAFMLLAFPALAATALASEEILSYDVTVNVGSDSVLNVEERIRVNAERQQIRHGIYRDFPVIYRLPDGYVRRVGFTITGITRDGHDEPWHSQRLGNYKRIYIGDKDVYVDPGPHDYVLRYRTSRQLRYFTDHDEIYWNATGNFWLFPIDNASARIVLPAGARILSKAAYTGMFDTSGHDWRIASQSDNSITFETTRALRANEGLTVAVGFPKGIVAVPSDSMDRLMSLRDNIGFTAIVAAAFASLLYFITTWFRVGRDPRSGTIIPLFGPPADMPPGIVCYVYFRGFPSISGSTPRAFIAGLMDMAMRGYMKIIEKDGNITLQALKGSPEGLSAEETVAASHLFNYRDSLSLTKTYGRVLQKAISEFRSSIAKACRNVYFRNNYGVFAVGVGISVLAIAALYFLQPLNDEQIQHLMVTGLGGLFAAVLISIGGRRVLGWIPGTTSMIYGIVMLAIGVVIMSKVVFDVLAPGIALPLLVDVGVLLLAIVNVSFFYLLRAPTDEGRKVMDKIEGFRMYLTVAEEGRLNVNEAPQMSQQLFERFLPYAIALGVEKPWTRAFQKWLVVAHPGADESAYAPTWYSGRQFNASSLDRATASMVAGISASMAAAMPSQTSSGSSGGGSSGGGGGGGGGGGW